MSHFSLPNATRSQMKRVPMDDQRYASTRFIYDLASWYLFTMTPMHHRERRKRQTYTIPYSRLCHLPWWARSECFDATAPLLCTTLSWSDFLGMFHDSGVDGSIFFLLGCTFTTFAHDPPWIYDINLQWSMELLARRLGDNTISGLVNDAAIGSNVAEFL